MAESEGMHTEQHFRNMIKLVSDEDFRNVLLKEFDDVVLKAQIYDANKERIKAFDEILIINEMVVNNSDLGRSVRKVINKYKYGEEEKFYYRLPGFRNGMNYINLEMIEDTLDIDSEHETNSLKTQFTQSDIENLTDEQQKLFVIAEKERVE